MTKQLFITILTLFCLTASGQDLKQVADSIRIANDIPAMAYAVLKSDAVLEINTCGMKRNDRNDQVNINSRFHLGSNSKAVTAFIAAWLVEDRKLAWDTRFFDLFPKLLLHANKAYDSITLGDLLSHRAGIQPFTSSMEFLAVKLKGSPDAQKIRFAEFLLNRKPQQPQQNKSYVYSNAGYALAALMLEKASGKSYRQLVNEVMNERLKLHVLTGWPNLADTSQTYGHQGKAWGFAKIYPLTDTAGYKINELIVPAGDLNMTLPDYAKFIQLFLKGIKGTDNFLKASTYDHLLFGLPEYSLGWGNGLKDNKYIAAHDGSGGTFYCHAIIHKTKDLAIIIVANAAEEKTVSGIYALRQFILKKYGN